MKRFLGILVASMFLGSAVYAAEEVGEQKTPDKKSKSDVKSSSVPKSRAETEDRKVGFEGEQKTPGKKTKSDVKSGSVPKSRAETEDTKVGFVGEQKTPDKK